ncbi:hypothetical protein AB0B28_06455 [Glycomyces sp. NPDC046736]|uniref:hypothetical protein n=1 Tax=Glycomyces sp. NPDC046736 TaxID=3155615 RepID=UPI0033E9E09F
MTVTNRVLAEGRLIEYRPHLPGTDDRLGGMVGVVSPITGQRRTLAAVPVCDTGQLIAVLSEGISLKADDFPVTACAKARTSLLLAAGRIDANTPIPGKQGPADLVGCAPGEGIGPSRLHPATEHVLGRMVRLELHGPECICHAVAAGPHTWMGAANA